MKKQLFALLGLGLLLTTASAFAQTVALKADIPFNFIVDGKTLPAGEYTIQTLGSASRALLIRASKQRANGLVMANSCESLKPADRTKLVFKRYGDQYFLAKVWVAGNVIGHEIPKSNRETEVAMDYTGPEEVVIAALR